MNHQNQVNTIIEALRSDDTVSSFEIELDQQTQREQQEQEQQYHQQHQEQQYQSQQQQQQALQRDQEYQQLLQHSQNVHASTIVQAVQQTQEQQRQQQQQHIMQNSRENQYVEESDNDQSRDVTNMDDQSLMGLAAEEKQRKLDRQCSHCGSKPNRNWHRHWDRRHGMKPPGLPLVSGKSPDYPNCPFRENKGGATRGSCTCASRPIPYITPMQPQLVLDDRMPNLQNYHQASSQVQMPPPFIRAQFPTTQIQPQQLINYRMPNHQPRTFQAPSQVSMPVLISAEDQNNQQQHQEEQEVQEVQEVQEGQEVQEEQKEQKEQQVQFTGTVATDDSMCRTEQIATVSEVFYKSQKVDTRNKKAIDFIAQVETETVDKRDTISNKQAICSYAPTFLLKPVAQVLKSGTHANLETLLAQTSLRAEASDDEIVGLLVAMILIGGAALGNLPKFLKEVKNKRQTKTKDVLVKLKFHLNAVWTDQAGIIEWVGEYWKYFSEQQELLIKRRIISPMKRTRDQLRFELQLSRLVTVPEETEKWKKFFSVCKTVEKCGYLSKALLHNIDLIKKQSPMSLEYLQEIQDIMDNSTNEQIISPDIDKLHVTKFADWKTELYKMIAQRANDNNAQSQSKTKAFVTSIQAYCGNLKGLDRIVEEMERNTLFATIFTQSAKNPRNMQRAIAYYIVAGLKIRKKQVWSFPTGIGKSYIMALVGLVFLHKFPLRDVYFVSASESLIGREKEDFKQYWATMGSDDQVNYTCKLDNLKPTKDSLVLIDEADWFMYDDPGLFFDFIEEANHVVCFTATYGEKQTIEEIALNKRNIKSLTYQPSDIPAQKHLEVDQYLSISTDKEICDAISQLVKRGPVLVFCTNELKTKLETAKLAPVYLGNCNDYVMLRNLQNVRKDGNFQLIVATDSIQMRGTDFRSYSKIMTLLITKPFANRRELEQGLGRVGRNDDACARLAVMGIELYDRLQESKQLGIIVKYETNQKQLKLQEKRANKQSEKAQPKDKKKDGKQRGAKSPKK